MGEEQKIICNDEAKERGALLSKYRNLEHQFDGLHENFDEETVNKQNLKKQLEKANAEINIWKQKYEVDGMKKIEELEMSKLKLQARLSEAESSMDQLHNKLYQLEKMKVKAQEEMTEMASILDQAHIKNAQTEKKAKQYDRVVGEWKIKIDGPSMDLDISQKETRNVAAELYRVKTHMM